MGANEDGPRPGESKLEEQQHEYADQFFCSASTTPTTHFFQFCLPSILDLNFTHTLYLSLASQPLFLRGGARGGGREGTTQAFPSPLRARPLLEKEAGLRDYLYLSSIFFAPSFLTSQSVSCFCPIWLAIS